MYQYISEQLEVKNGKSKLRRVTIKGVRGTKEVIQRTARGKIRRSRKTLKKSEVACIKRCQFIPGLFTDCEKQCEK
jgi:hypothetical protein